MMLSAASSKACVVRSNRPSAVKPTVGKALRLPVQQRTAAPAPSNRMVSTRAVEIATVAGEAGFIAGTAFTMMAMTLVGLAVGFVLLRVESLVEEGKL